MLFSDFWVAGSLQLLPELHNIRVDEQSVQEGLLQTPQEDLLQGISTNSATVSIVNYFFKFKSLLYLVMIIVVCLLFVFVSQLTVKKKAIEIKQKICIVFAELNIVFRIL